MYQACVKVFLPRGISEQRMPLMRYFTFVGGALLALLFMLDAYLPKLPVLDRGPGNLPVIRIHSDRKWPDRVVYDTSHPTIVPTSMASSEVIVQAPVVMTEASVGPRKWQALAMLPPSGVQLRASDTKMREPRPRHQGKLVKKHPPVPRVALAGRLQFSQFRQPGWYTRSFW
jgi:hypothetical protein